MIKAVGLKSIMAGSNEILFFKKYFLNILIMLCVLLPTTLFAYPVIVRAMHVASQRIIFSLSSKTRYHFFTLQHPNRFVLDLHNTRTFLRLHYPVSPKTPVQNFRYATHRDGVFRMVFLLREGVRVVVSTEYNRTHQPQLVLAFHTGKQALLPSPKNISTHTSLVAMFTPIVKHYRDVIVVVDPGHGGKDPGATGIGGTKEKMVVLKIAKRLQYWIDRQPGYRALLTRTGDYYLTLRQRLHIARRDHADMFIAIHADKWHNMRAHGVSVFALSQRGATSEAARWLAARENASELMGGVELNDKSHLLKSVLINLSQVATIRTSLKIGADILKQVKPFARLHHDTVEQAAFVVLKSPDIPSLLVETGFLSNPREEQRLKNPIYQNKLAHALMRGICNYFRHAPPHDTWLRYWRTHPSQYNKKTIS